MPHPYKAFSVTAVDGAIRCLSLLVDDLAEEQIVQVLIPHLHLSGQYCILLTACC